MKKPHKPGAQAGKGPNVSPQHIVTMRDIAEEVGVTQATVSMALKNSPRISEVRRREIHTVAEQLGYMPNPNAASLAHRRHQSGSIPIHGVIAWINAWPEPEKLRQFYQFAAYWEGASKAAAKFGYRLEEFVVSKNMSLGRIERILHARGITGILIPPHLGINAPWNEVDWSHFSVVRFGVTAKKLPPFHAVTADQSGNAYLAFSQMRKKGYKRIGYAGITLPVWRGLAGFMQAQCRVPERQRIPPMLHRLWEGQQWCTPRSLEKTSRWLKTYQPDAVLADYGPFWLQLKSLGYETPRDFGLATTANPDCPIGTGIDQNPEEIGRVGLLLLLSQIRDNARGVPPIFRQVLVTGKWVDDGVNLPSRR